MNSTATKIATNTRRTYFPRPIRASLLKRPIDDKCDAYRKGAHWVFVSKTDLVSETWAPATLGTCGFTATEIR
jgi:hypothetical protein